MSTPFDWRAHLKVHPAADLFPVMAQEELRALADDITVNGLRAPILLWSPEGQPQTLLDGRNRLDALALLGLLGLDDEGKRLVCNAPTALDYCFHNEVGSELDPYALVLSLNVHRRHLTSEQKRGLIAKVLKLKPEQSNRAIAKQVKADDKTVGKVRAGLESTAEIPQLKKTIGADGRCGPRTRRRRTRPHH